MHALKSEFTVFPTVQMPIISKMLFNNAIIFKTLFGYIRTKLEYLSTDLQLDKILMQTMIEDDK